MAGEEAPAPDLDHARLARDSKHTHVGSGSVPSTTDSRKRRSYDGIDMNKKPNKIRKHKPKVFDDSKPKKVSTPRPKTPNPVKEKRNTFTKSSTGKRKKVPMPQSPRASTPRPKTPNQVQERMQHPRKCKRSLDFDYYQDFHHMSEQPPRFGEFDYFGKIVASKDLLEDDKKQKCWEDIIPAIRNQVRAEKHVIKPFYCYQRRKKKDIIIPMLQVYQRRSIENNRCLQSSKKIGPNCPSVFKKQRAKRKKSTTVGKWWYVEAVKDGKIHVKRSYRKHGKGVRIRVNKSKYHKGVVKPKKRKKPLNDVKTMVCDSERCGLRKDLSKLDVRKLIKDLMVKIENLDINGQSKELVVRDCNVVVKRKLRAKVELDEETLSTWKFLMENDGSKPADQETDKDKEEWWERQRKLFRGRVDSFIAKMHLIQGNRRFSPWKGSVVDSVVGAFLTQNVSDHLSSQISRHISNVRTIPNTMDWIEIPIPSNPSNQTGPKYFHVSSLTNVATFGIFSAFMSLVARFPVKSRGKEVYSKVTIEQETKTDWERLRRSYCKTVGKGITNENNMDAVDWDAVRCATVEEISKTIVERGMNNKLAARIKAFLERLVIDHGSIDLEWLRDVPPDKAKEYLLSIRGIGLKSVECIRLLTLHHLAFPVDTNVGRVATRLGWVPLQPLPEEVQIHLLNSYPMVNTIQQYLFPRLCTLDQKTLYELHYQLITFGKVFCTKRTPNCNACPMRAECRHYASAFASARLTLPGLKESSATSIVPAANEQNHGIEPSSADLQIKNLSSSSYDPRNKEPIIEVPSSPEPDVEETLMPIISDIEDLFCDEIPTIRLNTREFRETIKESTISLPEDDMSKALVAFTTQPTASIPRMKFVAKLRTVHFVYELPDSHMILAEFDKREHDDPSPYLLAIWLQENIGCNSSNEETVKGTVLIPCRTANRGKFPLNGTYFQVNEVFADDETSRIPMDVPRCELWNLPRRYLGCGTSATSIFKALSTDDIQRCFWKGSICVRGFNRKTRRPHPLHRRFHISTTAVAADGKKILMK